jgi:hypothetical protein
MNRNAHQIFGWYDKWPNVKFVTCCADTDARGKVVGGTGHACRIAKSVGIPIYNIREYLKKCDSKYVIPFILRDIQSGEEHMKLAVSEFENQMMNTGLIGLKSKKDDPNIWMELN